MKARVTCGEAVKQAVLPSSKPLIESAYAKEDQRHCTMELFEFDGELPLKMMVGSVVLLEVQPVELLVEPSRILQVRMLRFGQVHMLGPGPVHMRTIGQV